MRVEWVLERIGPIHEEVVINKIFFNCGRMKDRDLVCLSLLVSREHCVFSNIPAGLFITDFASANGIYVNGELQRPRRPILLKDNDIVGIGCGELECLEPSMFVYKVKSRVVHSNGCDSTSANQEEKAEATNQESNNEERAMRKEQSRMRRSDSNNVPNKVPKTVDNQEQRVPEICNIIDDDDDIIEIIECPSSSKKFAINQTNNKPTASTSGQSNNVSTSTSSQSNNVILTASGQSNNVILTTSGQNNNVITSTSGQSNNATANVAHSNSKISNKNTSIEDNEIMEIEIAPAVPTIKSEPVFVNTASIDATSVNIKQEPQIHVKHDPQNNVKSVQGLTEIKQEPEFYFSQIDLVEIDDDEEDGCFPSSQLFDKTSIKEEQEDCPEAESLIFLDDDDENIVTILDSDDEHENPSAVNKDIYSNVRIKQEYPELNELEDEFEKHVSYVNTDDNIENGTEAAIESQKLHHSFITEAAIESTAATSENTTELASEGPAVPLIEEPVVPLIEEPAVPLIEEPAVPLIEEPAVDPLALENVNEIPSNALFTENVNKTLVEPEAEQTLADSLVAEHVNGKISKETAKKDKTKVRKKGVEIIEPHIMKTKRRSGKTEKKDKKKSKESSKKKSSSSKGKHSSDSLKSSSSRLKSKSEESSADKSKDKSESSTKKDRRHKDGTSPEHSKENEITNEKEKETAAPIVQKTKHKMTNVKVKVSTKSRGDMLCDSMQTLRPVSRKPIKKTTEAPKTAKPADIGSTFVIPRRQVPLSSTSLSPSTSRSNSSFSSTNGLSSSTSFDKVASTVTETADVTSTVIDNRPASVSPTVTPTIVNHKESPNHTENDRIPSPLLAVEPVINSLATSLLKSLNSATPNKKKVSFKENIAAIREYPIEAGNQMRNIKDGLNLRASRRDGIHRPLEMKLEDFLARIFAWEPVWLEQQQKVKDLPPIVKNDEMQPLPNSFESYEKYYKKMEVLLLLETWQLLYKEYECTGTRYKQSKALHCTFVRHSVRQMQTPNGLRYSMLAINTLVTNQDLRLQNHPVFGDMIILEYFAKHDGVQKFRRAFAYVIEVQQQNSLRYLRANSDSQLIKYCPSPDALMTYIVQTRIIDEHTVQFQKIARLRSILYLRSHLRLIQGLQYVPHSCLRDSVLNVDIDDFQLDSVTNEQIFKYNLVTQEKLNEKQMEAVMKFTNASIKLEPKIGLLVGPPGTGKSKVIANLVTQILYGDGRYVNGQHKRILVCAPSNAAIDEIVLRLLEIRAAIKDYRFKMVRIGRIESMHEEVKKISVTELARREAQKAYSDHQHKNSEIAEQKKHKLRKDIEALELLLANNPHNMVYRNNLADLKTKFFKLANKSPEEENAELSKFQNSAKSTIINRADVIACTLSSCYTSQMESIFGTTSTKNEKIATCIVDEATQCCEAETLIPLMLGVKSLILVGDPNQLPATVMSTEAKKLGLDKSLFTRAKSALEAQCDGYNPEQRDPVIMLNVQYRMVNAISHWPNKYFYGGKLIDRVNYKQAFPFQPYRVLNLDGLQDDVKFSNTSEALFVGNLINCLMTCSKVSTWDSKITIGVITPYQNQKSVIMNTIREQTKQVPDKIRNKFVTEVNTIDSFQGQERDVIIMSCVRSCGIGFLSDQQRLCVALTRAKFSLIICGNFTTFQRDSMWKDLLTDARSRGVVARLNTKARPIDIKPHVIRLDM